MRHSMIAVPVLLALAACSPSQDQPAGTTATPEATPPPIEVQAPPAAASAHTTLSPTEGNQTAGSLQFTVVDGVVHATGEVTGLTAGARHGFHLHEHGDCSAPDATSAGGHFNPAGVDHGRVGHGSHHGGDSDNLEANADGVATVDARFEGVTIGDGAATDIVGKGVIVHADADDYVTQPTGNAGARLACGVIALGAD